MTPINDPFPSLGEGIMGFRGDFAHESFAC